VNLMGESWTVGMSNYYCELIREIPMKQEIFKQVCRDFCIGLLLASVTERTLASDMMSSAVSSTQSVTQYDSE